MGNVEKHSAAFNLADEAFAMISITIDDYSWQDFRTRFRLENGFKFRIVFFPLNVQQFSKTLKVSYRQLIDLIRRNADRCGFCRCIDMLLTLGIERRTAYLQHEIKFRCLTDFRETVPFVPDDHVNPVARFVFLKQSMMGSLKLCLDLRRGSSGHTFMRGGSMHWEIRAARQFESIGMSLP